MARSTTPEARLFLLSLFIPIFACRGERVHFRVHAGDVLDHHTHTRTVLLNPDGQLYQQLRQLPYVLPSAAPVRAAPKQAVSYIRQTMQLPLPASEARPGGRSGQKLPVKNFQQAPLKPSVAVPPAPLPRQLLPAVVMVPALGVARPSPIVETVPAPPAPKPRIVTKKTQTHMIAHQVTGPKPLTTHMILSGPGGMQLVAVTPVGPLGSAGSVDVQSGGKVTKMTAALLSPPSAADLKKGKGCRAFVRGAGEDVSDGDCFLEEYENGYNEEQSNKSFYGDDKSDSKTEKEGGRSTKKYRNESKFTRHPRIRQQWIRTPDGRHHLVHTEVNVNLDPHPQPPPQRAQSRDPGAGRARATGAAKPRPAPARRRPGTATGAAQAVIAQPATVDDAEEDEQAEQALEETDDAQGDDDGQEEQGESQTQRQDEEAVPEVIAEDGMVEVFKHAARTAPLVTLAGVTTLTPAKPAWMKAGQAALMNDDLQMDHDDDDFEAEESAPAVAFMSPEFALSRHVKPHHPRALDDMDLGWEAGFQDNVFDEGEKSEQQEADDFIDHAEYEAGPEDDGGQQQHSDDDGDDDEQEHAASEIVMDMEDHFNHPMLKAQGRSEKMLQQSRAGPANTDHDQDSPRLSAILASGGHVFAPSTPPAPHAAAFGALDPDRLEAGRRAPVVLEFGHELSDFKVTREREQKKWP